jgi:hypothetical protein
MQREKLLHWNCEMKKGNRVFTTQLQGFEINHDYSKYKGIRLFPP